MLKELITWVAILGSAWWLLVRSRELPEHIRELAPLIGKYSRAYRLPAPLVAAIIDVESGGRSVQTWEPSIADYAWGVMQITTPTARFMGYQGPPEKLLDPEQSIKYGTGYLRYQLDRYNSEPDQMTRLIAVISAYNAGTYTTANRAYVEKVLSRFQKWQGRI